ncbi:hypothetical protein B0H66DRAFT_530832 [Apodospora peruviana]|uniref:Uncharacterized protein n=1 Tax=Apodospora peruviana TaxID=516989 RepID=A0AAE0IKY6_9PEZI|nr:hypothetical protein B0H66DRAFT_530832 [Apodospora peruviana]
MASCGSSSYATCTEKVCLELRNVKQAKKDGTELYRMYTNVAAKVRSMKVLIRKVAKKNTRQKSFEDINTIEINQQIRNEHNAYLDALKRYFRSAAKPSTRRAKNARGTHLCRRREPRQRDETATPIMYGQHTRLPGTDKRFTATKTQLRQLLKFKSHVSETNVSFATGSMGIPPHSILFIRLGTI